MYKLIFLILWAIACPKQTGTPTTTNNSGQVTTMDGDDTGGETGSIPPKPPTPPKP